MNVQEKQYIGFSTICNDFRHTLGALEWIPPDKGGTVFSWFSMQAFFGLASSRWQIHKSLLLQPSTSPLVHPFRQTESLEQLCQPRVTEPASYGGSSVPLYIVFSNKIPLKCPFSNAPFHVAYGRASQWHTGNPVPCPGFLEHGFMTATSMCFLVSTHRPVSCTHYLAANLFYGFGIPLAVEVNVTKTNCTVQNSYFSLVYIYKDFKLKS